jgi:uncharacterized membrane protein (UPF0182 family)
VYGPRQIVGRINQDQRISPQITLWNQQGSQVIQGSLLVIPIGEALIYIRPLYLKAQGGRIPELKRVIVAYQNTIVMEETLDKAIDRIFGTQAPPAPPSPMAPAAGPAQGQVEADSGRSALAEEALGHYERALRAQREGDWSLYGEEIAKLGEVLKRMEKQPPR